MNKRLTMPYKILFVAVALFFAWHFGRAYESAYNAPERTIPPVVIYRYTQIEKPVQAIVERVEYIPAETQSMEFEITAYCSCRLCCGEWADNRPGGVVYTASGAEAVQGTTVAVDANIIPYGTRLYIDGVGERIAQDTGCGIKGAKLDLYYSDHNPAVQWGRQTKKVWILGD